MAQFLNSLEQSGLGSWVRDAPTIWAFPTILFLHTFGMAIVAGGSAMLSLMILGFWPATAKLTSLDFYIKMLLVFAGMYLLVRMRRQVFENPKLDEIPQSGGTKVLAWASLACWFGAITAGRLLAYVGPTAKH